MDQLRKQATKFGARVEHAFIDRVDFSGEKKLLFAGDKKFEASAVIITTGAAPRLLGPWRTRNVWQQGSYHLCHLR